MFFLCFLSYPDTSSVTGAAPCQGYYALLGRIFCILLFINMLSCLFRGSLQCPRVSVGMVKEQGVIGAMACLGWLLGKQGMSRNLKALLSQKALELGIEVSG